MKISWNSTADFFNARKFYGKTVGHFDLNRVGVGDHLAFVTCIEIQFACEHEGAIHLRLYTKAGVLCKQAGETPILKRFRLTPTHSPPTVAESTG